MKEHLHLHVLDVEEQHFINHNNLKTTDKEKMKELVNEVSKIQEVKKICIIFLLIKQKVLLEDSGIIMELRTPSLWDLLEIFRTFQKVLLTR